MGVTPAKKRAVIALARVRGYFRAGRGTPVRDYIVSYVRRKRGAPNKR